MTIQVSFPESLENFISSQVASGGYGSAGDYLLELVRLAQKSKDRAALEEKLLAGVDALDRGEGKEMTGTDWEHHRNLIREKYGCGD